MAMQDIIFELPEVPGTGPESLFRIAGKKYGCGMADKVYKNLDLASSKNILTLEFSDDQTRRAASDIIVTVGDLEKRGYAPKEVSIFQTHALRAYKNKMAALSRELSAHG